jgi:hypothetical protein
MATGSELRSIALSNRSLDESKGRVIKLLKEDGISFSEGKRRNLINI